jgi:hypothetical protein
MKPKFRRFVKKALPSLVVVPALMNIASAAVIIPDTLGNVLVPGNFSGAATVTAIGGSTRPFSVTIVSGASLTGDAGLVIDNLAGALIQGGNRGIHFDVTGGNIVNSSTIAGITGSDSDGIEGLNGMTISNNHSIAGRQKGIVVGDELDPLNRFAATITGTDRHGVSVGLNYSF